MSNSTLQRYLLLRLGIIISGITVLIVGLMAYVLFYAHDDSAEYYMQYEALAYSGYYAVGDRIVEFEPQVKEYYWQQEQLPDVIQKLIKAQGVERDKLNWYRHDGSDIYVYPHSLNLDSLNEQKTQRQIFWVVHYFLAEDLGEGFYFSRNLALAFVLVFIVLLSVAALFLSMKISQQLQRFSDWIDNLDNDCNPPAFNFVELQQAAFVLANSISAERQLQLEQQQLITREKAFLSTLSHELRTPMAVINTAIALLEKRGDLGQKDQSTLVKLATANDKMKLLSRTLLSLWRQQVTDDSTDLIDLNPIIKQGIEAAQQQGPLVVEIMVNQQSHDGQTLTVEANRPLLQLVLDNLLRNAEQYSGDGQAQLHLTTDGQKLLSVAVTNVCREDNLNPDGIERQYGYGLGLYLLAEICQQQGWQITAKQIDGQLEGRFVANVAFSPQDQTTSHTKAC